MVAMTFESISKGKFPMGSRDHDQNRNPKSDKQAAGQQQQSGHKPAQQGDPANRGRSDQNPKGGNADLGKDPASSKR